MFTTEQQDEVRARVLAMARSDPRVTAGALTGSSALGTEDQWSDIDVAFGIAEGVALETVLDDWTAVLVRDFGALHYWDLPAGPSIYRVFLLPGGLEVDIGVSPDPDFGARGPSFRPLFGTPRQFAPAPPPAARTLIGLGWHHILHARVYIERGKPWQAEYMISALRDHTLTLACLRLGEATYHAHGADRLPATVTEPLAASFVHSLEPAELHRALGVATACFLAELDASDPALCAGLTPLLHE